MEFFILYVFVIIEKIAAFLAIGSSIFWWSGFGIMVSFILAFLMSKNQEQFEENKRKSRKTRAMFYFTACVGVFMFVVSSLLPDKKELAIIVAGGMTYQVVTSEPAKQIGGKALELLNKKLDEAIKDEPKKDAANVSKSL